MKTETRKQGRVQSTRPIRLQDRDLDVLYSLSIARYLTVTAIEWLHFPGWRDRYKTYLEERTTDPSKIFYPTPNIYHRLVAMRTEPTAYVHRIVRAAERASVVFSKQPDVYVLSDSGAELLCTRRGFEMDELWYKDPRKKSSKNLEHSVAIGTFYAALRAALEHTGQQLIDWQGDHILLGRDLARGGPNYDRVSVAGIRDELPILPDGTFTLEQQRYFVEVDLGTTNLRSWSEKIRAYEVYRRSAKLKERYATDSFTVLVVAPNETRMRRIAEEVVKVDRQPGLRYRFTTAERVHPTTIRSAWKVIESCSFERRKIVDRLVEMPSSISFAMQGLWKAGQ